MAGKQKVQAQKEKIERESAAMDKAYEDEVKSRQK
jgi:hypothetical protein